MVEALDPAVEGTDSSSLNQGLELASRQRHWYCPTAVCPTTPARAAGFPSTADLVVPRHRGRALINANDLKENFHLAAFLYSHLNSFSPPKPSLNYDTVGSINSVKPLWATQPLAYVIATQSIIFFPFPPRWNT